MENLGCTSVQVAALLFWKTPLYTVVDFLSGGAESVMVAKGVPVLTIRKLSTTVASILQSSCAILFGLARTPFMAAVYYNLVVGLYGIHHSGFRCPPFPPRFRDFSHRRRSASLPRCCVCHSSNLIEVGGEDTAMMNAISNCAANVPGFVTPIVGAVLRSRTTPDGRPGSLMPLFIFSSAFQLLAGLSFGCFASMTPARDILAARDAHGGFEQPVKSAA